MWVSVTGKGKPEQPPAVDEDTEEGRNGDKPAALFPKPRFVFTIYTPNRVTLNNELLDPGSATQEVWKGCTIGGSSTVVKPTVGGEEPQGAKIKKYVKMNSLVIKMLNRLIRDTIIQREAIQYSPGEKFVLVQILVAAAVIPTLVMKCERIGVGNVVGQCYVTPLETSLLPSPGPIQLLEDSSILISTPKGPQQGIDPAKEADDEADETEAVSSDEEDDAPEDVSADPSSFAVKSIGVPFLSKTRREELKKEIKQARKEWLATGARIRVEQVAEQIIANAAFTWDYTAFVMCAASIAAIGLGTNSSVSVIASMLISPIMGPVLSFTFGTTLRNRSMIMTGLRNELISLALCVLTGLIWGLVAAFANVDERRNWPSDEMTSRGDVTGLLSGIAVALISGVATALSTLGNNSSGMTGVAISLSLLPPAVNAGMCWMFAILVATGAVERNAGDNEQYWELGTVSFGLTMANIVCIWLTGVFTFWLKEVSPYQKKNAFWSRDIHLYRENPTTKSTVDTDKINDGIKAMMELREAAGNDVYETHYDVGVSTRKVAAARRQGLAGNAMEDAFFMDTDLGMDGKIITGGAASDALPDENTLLNARPTDSLMQNVDRFGEDLGTLGEGLFDDAIFNVGGESLSEDGESLPRDVGIDHADVANAIILQGVYNGDTVR